MADEVELTEVIALRITERAAYLEEMAGGDRRKFLALLRTDKRLASLKESRDELRQKPPVLVPRSLLSPRRVRPKTRAKPAQVAPPEQ